LASTPSKITSARPAMVGIVERIENTMRYSPQLLPSAGARSKRLNRPSGTNCTGLSGAKGSTVASFDSGPRGHMRP
jgi:tetrahydromethanopterin S-methyltransferase subunit F